MNPSHAWSLLTARCKGGIPMPPGVAGLTSDEVAAMLSGLERGPYLMGLVHFAADVHSLPALERWLTIQIAWIHAELNWGPAERGGCISRRLAATVLFEVLQGAACEECNGLGTSLAPMRGVEVHVRPKIHRGRTPDVYTFEETDPKTGEKVLKTVRVVSGLHAPELHVVHWRRLRKRLSTWKAGDNTVFIGSRVWMERLCPECQGSGRSVMSGRKRARLAGLGKDAWSRTWAARYEPLHTLALGWRDRAWSHLAEQLSANLRAAS